jgi:hypothetical protein
MEVDFVRKGAAAAVEATAAAAEVEKREREREYQASVHTAVVRERRAAEAANEARWGMEKALAGARAEAALRAVGAAASIASADRSRAAAVAAFTTEAAQAEEAIDELKASLASLARVRAAAPVEALALPPPNVDEAEVDIDASIVEAVGKADEDGASVSMLAALLAEDVAAAAIAEARVSDLLRETCRLREEVEEGRRQLEIVRSAAAAATTAVAVPDDSEARAAAKLAALEEELAWLRLEASATPATPAAAVTLAPAPDATTARENALAESLEAAVHARAALEAEMASERAAAAERLAATERAAAASEAAAQRAADEVRDVALQRATAAEAQSAALATQLAAAIAKLATPAPAPALPERDESSPPLLLSALAESTGSWRAGVPVPGKRAADGSPDMRDALNRRAFLGIVEGKVRLAVAPGSRSMKGAGFLLQAADESSGSEAEEASGSASESGAGSDR